MKQRLAVWALGAVCGGSPWALLVVCTVSTACSQSRPAPSGSKTAQQQANAAAPSGPRKKVNPKDGLTYVWIPPGSFQMGCSSGDSECEQNEKPPRSVEVRFGFWIGQTEVTQKAYWRVTGLDPSEFKGERRPVEKVNWHEARSYCKEVGLRLPTATEWEYAARAGNTSARYGNLDVVGWYEGNSGKQTHEVGQKQPNAWGLYDMLGNVSEWTLFGDPLDNMTIRGGDWSDPARKVRVSKSQDTADSARVSVLGFRCAGVLEDK